MKVQQLIVFIGILFFHTAAFGQWTQAPGEYYAKAQVGAIVGKNAFALDGEIIPVKDFGLYSLSFYGELGIEEYTTLSLTAGIGHASYDDKTTVYLNPVMLGSTNQLYLSDRFAVSSLVRGGFDAGLNNDDLSSNPVLEFRTATELAYIAEGLLQVGLSFNRFFSAISGGARYHSAYGVDILAGLSLGYSFDSGLVPILTLNYNHAIDRPTIINISGRGPTRYFGLGLGLGWWISKNIGFVAELFTAPYAISNAGAPVFGLGIQFR